MSLIIAIIFLLAGLGILAPSTFEYIRAPYSQDQMVPVCTMIVGAIFLMGGGIVLSIWDTARKQMARLNEAPEPAVLEGIGSLHATAKKTNDLLEKILQQTSSSIKAPPVPLTRYFYADAERKPHGPFTGSSLKEMLANGVITMDTPVAEAGSDKWLPCSTYSELR